MAALPSTTSIQKFFNLYINNFFHGLLIQNIYKNTALILTGNVLSSVQELLVWEKVKWWQYQNY